ncbi:MAG: hypothetical protein ACP5GY_00240 [Vulcanisaeta sp.]
MITIENKLRNYITYAQLILWPRISVSIKDQIYYLVMMNASNRGEGRTARCSGINIARRSLL